MKTKLLLFLLILLGISGSTFAQGIRLDATTVQEMSTTAIPGTTNVLTVPAAPIVKFCSFPANAVPCTNLATTFTSSTLGTPCNTSTQITLVGSTTCVASPDANGNFGFWAVAGTYAYTVTLPGGINLGPYNVTLGIPSGTNLPSITTGNFNSVLVVDGITFANCAAAITAAGGVNKTVIIVPSTYAGAECPTQTNVDGIQQSITTPNITIWDFRGGNVGHNLDFNSNAQDTANHVQSRLSVWQYSSATPSNFTTSAIIGTNQVTTTIPSGSISAGTFETDLTGTIVTNNGGIIQSLNGESAVRSLGGTIPGVDGVSGASRIDRGPTTTNIGIASGVHGYACSNSSVAGATINQCFAGLFEDPASVATRNNYSIGIVGNAAITGEKGFDIFNGGSAAIKALRFSLANNRLEIYGPTINQGARLAYFNIEGTHFNFVTASQFNVSNCFEVTPSTVVGGGTFTTPIAQFCQASPNFVIPAGQTMQIGGGSTLTKYYVVSAAITPAATAANQCVEQTFTPAAFNGVVNAGDNLIGLSAAATMAANGVFPVAGSRLVANGIAITYCNSTAGALTAPAVTITAVGTR